MATSRQPLAASILCVGRCFLSLELLFLHIILAQELFSTIMEPQIWNRLKRCCCVRIESETAAASPNHLPFPSPSGTRLLCYIVLLTLRPRSKPMEYQNHLHEFRFLSSCSRLLNWHLRGLGDSRHNNQFCIHHHPFLFCGLPYYPTNDKPEDSVPTVQGALLGWGSQCLGTVRNSKLWDLTRKCVKSPFK